MLDESNGIQPFVRISFISITAQTTIKTFDIELNASLANLIIVHEQFLSNMNEPLRLFSTENNGTLFAVKCLFTSPENPLFYSDPYNSIENRIQLQLICWIICCIESMFEAVVPPVGQWVTGIVWHCYGIASVSFSSLSLIYLSADTISKIKFL